LTQLQLVEPCELFWGHSVDRRKLRDGETAVCWTSSRLSSLNCDHVTRCSVTWPTGALFSRLHDALADLEVFIPARQFVRWNVHVFRITVEVAIIDRAFDLSASSTQLTQSQSYLVSDILLTSETSLRVLCQLTYFLRNTCLGDCRSCSTI